MGVGRYILARIGATVPMIWVLLTLVFVVLRVLPGDPALAMLGGHAVPQATIDNLRRQLGLDRPLIVQYGDYLWGVLHGNLGQSSRTGHLVLQDVLAHLPATLELAACALVVAALVGLVSGVFAATHADGPGDHAMRLLNIAAFATFIPWVGIMLKLIFSVTLHWLPTGDRLDPMNSILFTPITHFYLLDALLERDWGVLRDALTHLVLPSVTLGLVLSGFVGRVTRAGTLEVLGQDYVRTARAKGLSGGQVVRRHVLRNTMIPVVTVIGLQFALLMAGAILTETTFNWPGVARYLLDSIRARDFAAIQGTVVVIGLFVTSVNLLVDVAYAWIDPRVKY
ncbi:MAG TPA: ABC transporter permease [Limnochordia bacterium]|nr:ABC transporter permease [Limnochordia bacterium]